MFLLVSGRQVGAHLDGRGNFSIRKKKLRMQKYPIWVRVDGGLRRQSDVKLLSEKTWQVVKKRGQPNYSMPAQRSAL